MSHVRRNWKRYAALAAAGAAAYYGVDIDQVRAALEAVRSLL